MWEYGGDVLRLLGKRVREPSYGDGGESGISPLMPLYARLYSIERAACVGVLSVGDPTDLFIGVGNVH